MKVYLDNAATTLPFSEVIDIMNLTLKQDYGNPSSMHTMGVNAEKYVRNAKETIAKSLKVDTKEIIFTSGGTEANNQALIGTAFANRRRGTHIISTKIEHASVHNPLIFLEEQGFQVTYASVDKNGRINLDELLDTICENTILVSIMHVNNEIGAVQDIETISKKIKEKNKDIIFHVDAIQSFGKYKIFPKRLGIDLLSVSGHKIHGPKGIGFLYVKDKLKIQPYIHGGGQQNGMRSGTENVPGIAGLGVAVELIYNKHTNKIEALYELKQYLIEQLNTIENVSINAIENISLQETAPHIVSVCVDGVKSEVLLHALEDKGVYVSSGSACSSNHPALSGTLQSIGLEKKRIESTIRFSLSINTTKEELDFAVNSLKELLPILRKYVRK
ncbi:MAG: cysteine desulfurase [Lachnospiraceae bacterium]|nr:cysteine desulfurase [Lachnospiraceae bacterium]